MYEDTAILIWTIRFQTFLTSVDHLTFERGGGGVIYRWKEIFFSDRYVQDFFSYPVTMYNMLISIRHTAAD